MESRNKVIEDMQRVLTYLDDADMKDLFNRVIGKMPYSQHQMHYRTEIIDTGNLLC